MRALARFIMRGRMQAGLTALIGGITSLPLLTPATVALVTLRHGLKEGLQVLAWGLLPAIVLLGLGQQSALMAIVGVLTVLVSAAILRQTASWGHALMALVSCSVLGALVIALFAPALIAAIVTASEALFATMQKMQEGQALGWPVPNASLIIGFLASATALGGVAGLVLSRWWQSTLYNPNGFALEFHQLRLTQTQALVCIGVVIYCLSQSPSYMAWVPVFALPLLLAGIALVHAIAAKRHWPVMLLVFFYVALVLLPQFMLLLVIVAFIDVWLDFRGRLALK